MSKRINPVERAFDAYIALTETERAEFDIFVRGYARGKGQQPEKRPVGRPPGAKTKRANGAETAPSGPITEEARA